MFNNLHIIYINYFMYNIKKADKLNTSKLAMKRKCFTSHKNFF